MKLSRSQLKSLIKECIVEVLSEGIAASSSQLTESRRTPQRPTEQDRILQNLVPMKTMKKSLAAAISHGPAQRSHQHMQAPSRPPVSLQTGDPIMDDILAHTAATTLIEQNHGPSRLEPGDAGPADPFARAMAQHDPEEVFGEAADKWSKMAFAHNVPVRDSGIGIAPERLAPPKQEAVARGQKYAPPLDYDPYNPSSDD